jgi:transposase-like protein
MYLNSKNNISSMERIHYKCQKCGYKFSRNKEAEYKKVCPYCGRDSVIVDAKSDAHAILSDATNKRYEF